MKKIFCALLFMLSVHKIYPGFFSSYDKKTPEDVVRDLAIEQIDSPNDPYISYNLGVALYQTCKYDSAKNNFERAVSNAKNKNLKERSYFNLANSCYKNALSFLPVNWENENTKIEKDQLAAAIENAKTAVQNYESLLALPQNQKSENKPATVNLKAAKELVEKLMKKQQQQKQEDKKDDNKDQDKQKDQQDKKDQNKEQKQDGQQDKSSQDKSSQDKSSQDTSSECQEKQDKDQSDEQKQDQEKSKEQKESQKSKDSEQPKDSEQQAAQQAQMQQAPWQEGQKESAEEKSMRLMLENLQNDEDGLQKLIIQRQTKDQKPLQSGQKPW